MLQGVSLACVLHISREELVSARRVVKMRRGSEYVFSQVPIADIPRSSFNRSHEHKTTFNAGYLIPVYVDEVLPGDTFNVKMSCFARLATPIVPIMDNMFLDVFFFFVPNRLLWSNWQKFMGEQINPGDSIDYLVPQVTAPAAGWSSGSLADYFGLPLGLGGAANWACALPFRAYNLIWNEWFRDENLQTSLDRNMGDGPDNWNNYIVARRGKRHDYFTSCLPWPQKGPGVELPLGTSAPVLPDGTTPTWQSGTDTGKPLYADGTIGQQPVRITRTVNNPGDQNLLWTNPGLIADLSNATAATINSLRQAFQIQKLLERDARGGTRYTEILRSHFGVVSPDARLQRPEYLGGGSIPVNINPVSQTSSTDATTPQGNLAAFGTVGGSGIGFSHLGEQTVLNKEIYYQGVAADENVFGYQERWAEYRYFPSKITGKFRSTDATPLDVWHLAQEFTALPTLGATFIEDNPPVERVIAVSTEPHFLFDSVFNIRCVRPMPTYSVPGYIDHF